MIDAAAELFVHEGYARTQMDDVAAAVEETIENAVLDVLLSGLAP